MIHDLIYKMNLPGLEIKNNQYNFRCPICGDSKTNQYEKRGWIYKKSNSFWFHCFNGGCESMSFINFVKKTHPELITDIFKKKFSEKDKQEKVIEKLKESIQTFIDFPLISIDRLDLEHIAKKYVLNRMIPEDRHSLLYYTDDFKKFANEQCNNKYSHWRFTDERLIIPMRKIDGSVFAFQGRSLEEDSFLRYISCKIDSDFPKVFGLERVDFSKDIFCLEGPLDSLFIENGIAFAGSDLSEENLNRFFNKNQVVICFDLEPRNKEICDKIERFIKTGFRVCLLPKYLKTYGKDINKFIENGLTIDEINNIVKGNIVFGKKGLLQFKMWKEIK